MKRKCGEERYVIILDFCDHPLVIPQLFFNQPSKEHCANYETFCDETIEDLTHENNADICHFGGFLFGTAFAREVVII